MMSPLWRSYDPNLIQEPTVYRLNESVIHFGESIKEIINEDFRDGMIMIQYRIFCSCLHICAIAKLVKEKSIEDVQTFQPSGTHSDLSIQIPPRPIPFGGAGRIPKGSLKQAQVHVSNRC
uniref:Cyanate lyase C-terminal domain-containing protein n=1 Tax=Brassica oleracea var. oleracea TaxID=109376 RepID=A0A0D3A3K4_BRAOL